MPEPIFRSDMTVQLVDFMGGDHRVVQAAKVSTQGSDALDADGTEGFIDFLIRNKHCYDSETEVLTRRGWVAWPNATENDEFLALNPDTGEKRWERTDGIVHAPYAGDMIQVKSQLVDLMVTPDHRVLAAARTSRGWEWGVRPASQLEERSHKLPVSMPGKWGGGEGSVGPAIAALIGFVVGDAHVSKTGIEFHLKKSRKIEWLRNACSAAGFVLSETSSYYDVYRILGASPELRSLCEQTYSADRKSRRIPSALLDGSHDELEALFEGLMTADGHYTQDNRVHFSTASRTLRDQMQELTAKLGGSASWYEDHNAGYPSSRPCYNMTIRSDRFKSPRIGWTAADRARQVKRVKYNGMVHCATVPSGILYVRRNGKPMWSGNSVPVEHSVFTFLVECPIFVSREIVKHRMSSISEVSGRYKVLDGVFYVPRPDRPLVQVGKTGDYKFVEGSLSQKADVAHGVKTVSKLAFAHYQWLLEIDVAKEVARMVLPVNTYTSMMITLNARSLMNFLSLRVKDAPGAKVPSHALDEIHQVAVQMEEHFKAKMPATYKAFIKHGRVAP